ncbi:MAG: glycosyltransferase family 4 protein [Pseudomonadota bacterium]
MEADLRTIVILGGARDFHAMDWYRAVRRVCPDRKVVFVTDLFGGEGYTDLSRQGDEIHSLFVIDKLLFAGQSRYSNLWRNFVKLILLPAQAVRLRRILLKYPNRIVHAHPMYYMALCLMAGIKYVGTPQGDEVLIRPRRSRLYKYFSRKVLQGAGAVIVDSLQMKNEIGAIAGVNAHVFQNGINVDEILQYRTPNKRERIVSIRGMEDLYRIAEVVEVRNNTAASTPLTFIYPFADAAYLSGLRLRLASWDNDLGRLEKQAMYRLLNDSLLVISIPRSDSSPRSVYESIFAGACVAAADNTWISALPPCMRSRVFVVDLADSNWLNHAISFAKKIVDTPFIPSEQALELYDENRSIGKVVEKFY